MPTTLNCPTCGAPLNYDGGPDRSIRCSHCGNTVIVPEEFQHTPDPSPAAPKQLDLSTLLAQAGQWGDLAQLVKDGRKIEAIKLYRELTGVGLKEAKDAIEELEAGRMVTFAQNVVSMGSASVSMEQIQAELAEGHKIEAIKLYRQMTGQGLKEAKDAVERMEAGEVAGGDEVNWSEIRNLIAADQELEAIKRYREMTGADLKEAKDVVDALAAGKAAPRPAKRAPQPVFQKPRQTATRPNRVGWLGCLLPLLFSGGILGVIFWGWPLSTSGSFNQALEAAQNDARVTQAFGGRVERGLGFVTGEISCGGGCSANYTIPIQGPRGVGEIWVRSDSTNAGLFDEGIWRLDARVTAPDGEVIALGPTSSTSNPNVTVISTLSAPEIDATAGAKARATREAEATVTAQAAQRTATAEAEVGVQRTATAQAQATAQVLLNAQANWQTQLISDTFNSNANGWPTQRFDDGSLVLIPTVEDGLYRWDIRPASGGHYWNILPGAVPAATDFVASVDVRLASGGEGGVYVYGLAFRAEGQDYGFFGLTNTGNFRVLGVYGSAIYQFYDFKSKAINQTPGAVNRLTVRALGDNFAFEINGQTVFVWHQPDLNDGRIGLGADIGREGADAVIEFDNFEVTGP